MIDKLEQEFFKTFDIEPKHNDACKLADKYWYNETLANKFVTFDTYMEINGCPEKTKGCTSECKHAHNQEVYPRITDNILVNLIQIACEENIISLTQMKNGSKEYAIYFGLDKSCIFYEKSLKDVILRGFIEYSDDNDIYMKVQTLFEEDN